MPLLKAGRFVADEWIHLGEDDAIPPDGDITVPFARLAADYEQLAARPGRLGVQMPNSERAEALALFLPNLGLVILPFPAFTDGRAFSLARQLRGMGYTCELRASGAFLPDQLGFLVEVGFDSFDVSDRFPEAAWTRAASAITLAYQTIPGRAQIWRARHRDTAEASSDPAPLPLVGRACPGLDPGGRGWGAAGLHGKPPYHG
jgi:uncharacterized protein (DUF934 family)